MSDETNPEIEAMVKKLVEDGMTETDARLAAEFEIAGPDAFADDEDEA